MHRDQRAIGNRPLQKSQRDQRRKSDLFSRRRDDNGRDDERNEISEDARALHRRLRHDRRDDDCLDHESHRGHDRPSRPDVDHDDRQHGERKRHSDREPVVQS